MTLNILISPLFLFWAMGLCVTMQEVDRTLMSADTQMAHGLASQRNGSASSKHSSEAEPFHGL